MFKKQKQKSNSINSKFIPVFLGILTLVLCFIPRPVKAAIVDTTAIQLKLNTYTPGAGGQLKPDNLIQVSKDAGSVQIQAEVILTSPSSGITLGTDALNTGASSGSTIYSVGAGLDDMGTEANAGGVSCRPDNIALFGFGLIVGNIPEYSFTTCNFKKIGPIESGTIAANTPIKVPITVNFSDFKTLDTSNTASPQRIGIYPYLTFTRTLTTKTIVFVNGGFPLYVQFYKDAAAASAAIASGQRPTGVPVYGGGTISSPSGQSSPDGNGLIFLINKVITFLLQIVTEFLYFVFYWLLAPTIQAMLSIHTYTDTFANVIYPGWEIIRNVCNIFFIVSLLAIAMGTLFRVESYQFRHLLVQLIIAALLVNFSLVVCQAILAIADTIQNQFLPNNVEVIRSLARSLMVTNIRDAITDTNFASFGTFSQTISLLFYTSMSIASFGVFMAICAYLVIRIVMLWILLMLSPIAYVARVLPTTAGLASKWWETFLKYAFFTPIMAFFLNMAAIISTNQASVLKTVSSADFTDSTAPTLSAFVFKVASNILLLVFLFVALQVAEQFGIYGASIVTENARKGWFAPFKVAAKPFQLAGQGFKAGAEAGVNWFQRKKMETTSKWVDPADKSRLSLKKAAFFALNPTALKNAVKERGEERMHAAEHVAQASASVGVQRFWKETAMDERSEVVMHGAAEHKKKFEGLAGERAKLDNLHELKQNLNFDSAGNVANPDEVDKQRWIGQILDLVDNRGLNEVLKQAERFGSKRAGGYSASAEGLSAFLNEMVERKVLTAGEAGHMLTQINDVAYKNKEYWYAEDFNTHDGHPVAFHMARRADGTYEERVEGETQYNSVLAAVDTRMRNPGEGYDEINRRIAAEVARRGIPALPPDEAKFLRKTHEDQLRDAYKKTAGDALTGHGKELYENYNTYVGSQLERAVNYKKQSSQADARDGHYTRFNRMRKDGFSEFNDLGINFIATFDYSRARQAGEWNPQSTAASTKSYYTHPEDNVLAVKEQIQTAERENPIYSGAKAALRMQAFKHIFLTKRIDKDDTRKLMLEEIDKLSDEIKGLGRSPTQAEVDGLITAHAAADPNVRNLWAAALPTTAERAELTKLVSDNAR